MGKIWAGSRSQLSGAKSHATTMHGPALCDPTPRKPEIRSAATLVTSLVTTQETAGREVAGGEILVRGLPDAATILAAVPAATTDTVAVIVDPLLVVEDTLVTAVKAVIGIERETDPLADRVVAAETAATEVSLHAGNLPMKAIQ